MSKNLEAVIAAFEQGKAKGRQPYGTDGARNGAWCGRNGFRNPCWTDGRTVYSYAMPIACRERDGSVSIADIDRAFRPDGRPSATTRGHIRALQRHAFSATDTLIVIAHEVVIAARASRAA